MKKKQVLKHLLIVAVLAALTAGCSDDNAGNPADREPITPDAGGIPVAFTADINPGSNPASASPDAHAGDPATRTVLTPDATDGGFTVTWKGTDTYPSDCDHISIWAAKGENDWANEGNPKLYLPTTSAVSSPLEPWNEMHKLTLPSEGDWKFTAIYGTENLDSHTATMTLSPMMQSAPGNANHIAAYDFSVATATQHVDASGAEMPAVSLQFKHKLSALQLNVTNNTGDALTISEIRLSRANGQQIDNSRNYDIATGSWKADALQADYLQLTTASNFPALPSGGTQSQALHMLLFPGYAGEDLTITVVTDRGEYAITKTAPDGGFAEGTNYNVALNVHTTFLDANETWTEYISTVAQLKDFRDRVNSGENNGKLNARLTADIDLENGEWTPIATESSNFTFAGTFDGGGYQIKGLNVSTAESRAGLFGSVLYGTVRNLHVSGKVTSTSIEVGGIAGYLDGTCTVENCIFSGDVSGKSIAGGIAGNITGSDARVVGCHTKGKVTATEGNVGGIAGQNYGSIDGCYSEATVTTAGTGSKAGGIAGNCSSGTLTHCYATGSISGRSSVGGILGSNTSGTLTGCIALNPGLTRTEGSTSTTFGRVAGYNYQGIYTSCAAFTGMTITDASGTTINPGTSSKPGDDLTKDACLTKDAYTSRGFTDAAVTPDATAPVWTFSATATYLPWNPAFASFHGIKPADYRIAVPDYLKGVTQ